MHLVVYIDALSGDWRWRRWRGGHNPLWRAGRWTEREVGKERRAS